MEDKMCDIAEGTEHGTLTQGLELLALHRITKLIGQAVDLETTLASILPVLYDTMRMDRAG